MQQGSFNSKERLLFFDAVISWTSEVNKELEPSASSTEIVEAYKCLSKTYDSSFKTKNGTWRKTIGGHETGLLKGKIVWLRTRVIM